MRATLLLSASLMALSAGMAFAQNNLILFVPDGLRGDRKSVV